MKVVIFLAVLGWLSVAWLVAVLVAECRHAERLDALLDDATAGWDRSIAGWEHALEGWRTAERGWSEAEERADRPD